MKAPRLLTGLAIALFAHAAIAQQTPLDVRATYDSAAALELGLRLELGVGYQPDAVNAARFVCQSATAGYGPAVRHLAITMLEPTVPGYNPALAGAWLRFIQTRERLGLKARDKPPPCPGGVTPVTPQSPSPFAALAAQLAVDRGLPINLVKAVILAESAWRPTAVSSAGAQGLMQLMPATARRHGVSDAFDPEQNLRGGMDHLVYLMRLFNDPILAVAAYNAGETPVLACRCVPRYPETEEYILRIKSFGGFDTPAAMPPARPARAAAR